MGVSLTIKKAVIVSGK